MPPPVEDMSDEENGDIPFTDAKEEAVDGNGSDADEDEDDEEGVYIVEQITEHNWLVDGSLSLLVKWKGYENPEDLTWEPEEGLKEGAKDVLQAYYKAIGGRPKNPVTKPGPKAGPGRKRKSMADSKASTPVTASASADSKKQKKVSPKASETSADEDSLEDSNWVPKGKNWDKEIERVDTIIRDPDNQGLYAFLLWNNGKRSRVAIESCYEKCPRKMLKFYENHLVFREG